MRRIVYTATVALLLGIGAGIGIGRPTTTDAQNPAPLLVGTFSVQTAVDPGQPVSANVSTFHGDETVTSVVSDRALSVGLGAWS